MKIKTMYNLEQQFYHVSCSDKIISLSVWYIDQIFINKKSSKITYYFRHQDTCVFTPIAASVLENRLFVKLSPGHDRTFRLFANKSDAIKYVQTLLP